MAKLPMAIDSQLAHAERVRVVGDLYQLMQYQLAADEGSYFAKTFGGMDTESVFAYMRNRVHYLVKNQGNGIEATEQGQDVIATNYHDQGKIYVMALNIGTAMFYEALAQSPDPQSIEPYGFSLNDGTVEVSSSRVGIIELGDGYAADGFSPLERISVLVHEARHSDCTGGMSYADFEGLHQGVLPSTHSCGHSHVVCQSGTYAGYDACDEEAWGAYSVQAVFAAGIAGKCTNCSDEDRKIAQAVMLDSLSRVIPKDQMLAGQDGDPDMSSSDAIHQ